MTTSKNEFSSNTPPTANHQYQTSGGLLVDCEKRPVDVDRELSDLIDRLDTHRGLLLHSGFEVPGRYRRYDIGFVNPPLVFTTRGRAFEVQALSDRGLPILEICHQALARCGEVRELSRQGDLVSGHVPPSLTDFPEEYRTRQPSVLSALRSLVGALTPVNKEPKTPLGFYGAFGYDLVFQFEDLEKKLPRDAEQRDLVLYLPDELLVRDQLCATAHRFRFDFSANGTASHGINRTGEVVHFSPGEVSDPSNTRAQSDHTPGQFAAQVRRAKESFANGKLFEVTPGQSFSLPCRRTPSALFRQLAQENPAPFAFLANLGEREHLVGASPEMYVRVRGTRVETCPIAGTIARGNSALIDAERAATLLRCEKSIAELTMCTDVDRNDKARICEAGSVQIIGRRQLEFYSRLIHTVDHVEGRLRPEFDALDALVTHCWAVTVTGAPKAAAMQFLEDNEASPRRYYGGAVGAVGFDGSLNTGLTLRTIHIQNGQASVRAGATLLNASDPEDEEAECALKASALLAVLESEPSPVATQAPPTRLRRSRPAPRVLLVDHRDSFVHNLADYFRQAGGEVSTHRSGFDPGIYDSVRPQLVVLSPGPGQPRDFATDRTIELALARQLPIFGVCLGLQALVEYYGGRLSTLAIPQHGRASPVQCKAAPLFRGLPTRMKVGRYHSLYARTCELPAELEATATSLDDGCVMALRHRKLPLSGVQFHPESLLSADCGQGLALISNVLDSVRSLPG